MSNIDVDDPVGARIARILDAKRRDNAEVLSALKVAEDAWERLNKEVDTTIGQEFDLLASERDAVLAARDRLETPDDQPIEKAFVFAGRVFDNATKVGLPQVLVRVVRDRDVETEPIASGITDAAGAYRAIVPPEEFDQTGAATALRVEAIQAGADKPFTAKRLQLVLGPGQSQQVDLPVKQTRGLSGNVAAGEAARDSIDETVAAVEKRLESMKAAHTATTRFADLTRDGLKELSEAIASEPPPLDVQPQPEPTPEPEPEPTPEPEPAPEPEPEPVPEPRSTPLEKVPGIGDALAAKLRDAGIPDAETLVRTPFEKVADIVGEATAKKTIRSAENLLREG
jgi:Helix-hairpin-helix domain